MFYLCTPDRFMEAKSFREVTRSLTGCILLLFIELMVLARLTKDPRKYLILKYKR